MTIFAEKGRIELAFNKILKKDLPAIIPFVQKLGEYQADYALLKTCLMEMFKQNYECLGVYLKDELTSTTLKNL